MVGDDRVVGWAASNASQRHRKGNVAHGADEQRAPGGTWARKTCPAGVGWGEQGGLAWAEEAAIVHLDEAFGEHMLQEKADERLGRQGAEADLLAAVVGLVGARGL